VKSIVSFVAWFHWAVKCESCPTITDFFGSIENAVSKPVSCQKCASHANCVLENTMERKISLVLYVCALDWVLRIMQKMQFESSSIAFLFPMGVKNRKCNSDFISCNYNFSHLQFYLIIPIFSTLYLTLWLQWCEYVLTPMLKLPKKRNKKNHLLNIDLNALIRKMRKTPIFKDTHFLCEWIMYHK